VAPSSARKPRTQEVESLVSIHNAQDDPQDTGVRQKTPSSTCCFSIFASYLTPLLIVV
jgi:hypothetical protein